MDAHSKKLAISIWDWSDRFNPCLHREIKASTSKPWSRRTSDTSKEVTRTSNRIWSVCSRKGYKLPIKGGKAKTDTLRAMIAEMVLSNPRMLKLMQLQGVNYKGAFALEAAVEDPRRFSNPTFLIIGKLEKVSGGTCGLSASFGNIAA